jgi:mannose-6-phosphate isomerase-like protein (cupin superfamily)
MSSSTWKLGVMVAAVLASACDDRLDKDGVRAEASTAALAPATAGERTEATQAAHKHGFVQNIETLTENNRDFRRVIYTGRNLQLVLMRIPAGDHIGAEIHHDVDQFFRIESGTGQIVIDGKRTDIGPGSAMLVPAGAKHDVVADGRAPLELYTLYAPPNHRDGVVHRTRADAERDDEKFDGRTSE